MGWTDCVIWFLCLAVSESLQQPNSETVMHGEVQSPQYPKPYLPNLLKEWHLRVPKGYKIQLSLKHLDIKASSGCYQDSLTFLYDQKVLGKFCGQENSTDHPGKESILSPSNRMTLIFQTSDSTAQLQQHTGFSATYKAIDMDECSKLDPGESSNAFCSQICMNTPGSYYCSCHDGYKLHLDQRTCLYSCGDDIFEKHEGHLSSPRYPRPSPPFLSCKYIISVDPRFTVDLNFTDNFHIESVDSQQGPRCLHHWLQVTIPDREPMKLCGRKSPGLIATNSSTVRLDYHTDDEGLSHGWSLNYNIHEDKCPFPGNMANGKVTPVSTEYYFRDYIYVTCDQGYRLIMDGQEIKTFSAMCQSDGQWHLPLPECQSMSDDKGLSHGWSPDNSTDEVKCPFPGNMTNGKVTPVSTEYYFRDYIFVTCDQGYRLIMDGRQIKMFSAMCQSDGQWHLPLSECQSMSDDESLSPDNSTDVINCGEPEPLLNGGLTFLSGFQNQYRSVVQYHCNEPFYSFPGGANISFTCDANRKWRSNHNNVTPRCLPVCGQPTKLISAYARIIGGREAPDNTIPWQVLLSVNGNRVGGMVIADQWIMTAAHDLTHNGKPVSNKTVRIYMGHTNLKPLLGFPVFAASVHVHPEYNNPNGSDYNNDIALIKLQDTVTFNSSLMPVCLPAEDATYVTGMMGLVSGFGIMEIYPPRVTKKLKYVQLPVVEQDTCRNSINKLKKTRNNVPSLTNNMFCAGLPEGGKDSCLGDNGGPFVLRDDGQFWAAGIVSWGVDCGQQGTYRVFTRVTNYLDWINKTMQEN